MLSAGISVFPPPASPFHLRFFPFVVFLTLPLPSPASLSSSSKLFHHLSFNRAAPFPPRSPDRASPPRHPRDYRPLSSCPKAFFYSSLVLLPLHHQTSPRFEELCALGCPLFFVPRPSKHICRMPRSHQTLTADPACCCIASTTLIPFLSSG